MSELRSASYWVGHLMVILATVLGVYLAATAGFKQALKLELLQSDKGTYHVSESLYQELKFNDNNMRSYLDRISDKNLVFNEHIAGIRLNEYIFQASKESEATFEIAPSLLTEVSSYYFNMGNALGSYYQSGKESPASLMKIVKAETQKLETRKTLQRLANYNSKLADNLQSRGVPLSSAPEQQ